MNPKDHIIIVDRRDEWLDRRYEYEYENNMVHLEKMTAHPFPLWVVLAVPAMLAPLIFVLIQLSIAIIRALDNHAALMMVIVMAVAGIFWAIREEDRK